MQEFRELENFNSAVQRLNNMFERIQEAESQSTISALEREASALMREVQILAPRVWDDFIKLDRAQREKVASLGPYRGVEDRVVRPTNDTLAHKEQPAEEQPKKEPAKKKTRKKKAKK